MGELVMTKEVNEQELEKELTQCYTERHSLSNCVDRYGFANCINKLQEMYSIEEIERYLREYCKETFYRERLIISRVAFSKSFFGKELGYLKYKDSGNRMFEEHVNIVIKHIYDLEKKDFIATNRKEMNLENDIWRLCFCKGPALNKRDFDFTKISYPTLRKEAKMYYKHILWDEINFRNDRGLALLYVALNLITESDRNVLHFKDIEENHIRGVIASIEAEEITTQYGMAYTVESMRKMIQKVGGVIEYLMTVEEYPYKPKYNPVTGFNFRNTWAMSKNTDAIPDVVVQELEKYCCELDDKYKLIYEILVETGLRAKEVMSLEADCLTQSKKNEKYYVVEYTPYKILNKLKVKGQGNKQITVVSRELAGKIYSQIDASKELREAADTNYIFLRQVNSGLSNAMIALPQVASFVTAINKVIEQHNIRDESGELWHYTSRQARKTLGVKLAENGATSQEIANQLGHKDVRTTETYYAEVRQKRLTELNAEFYKKSFELLIGEKQLSVYTEEERKALYADFALNIREVEFGQCTKHISEGPCNKRNGATNCAICPKLCTGMKYLSKWLELRDCQNDIVDNLISLYKNEGIIEYEEFVEYKREIKRLNRYQVVIDSIQTQKGVN